MNAAKDHGLPGNLELETTDSQGRPVWLQIGNVSVRTPGGQFKRLIHLFHNASDQRRALDLIRDFAWRAAQLPYMQQDSGPDVREPATSTAKLTAREKEVIQLLASGLTPADIAKRLAISENTVRNHARSIREKLGLHSQVKVALYAIKHGLTSA